MQSAIGRRVLPKLDAWVETRRRNAAALTRNLADLPGLRVPTPDSSIGHAYYKYYAFVRPEMLRAGWDRDRIIDAINREGVPCFTGSCSEIYLEKAFPQNMKPVGRLEVARELSETSLMFLVHPTLSQADMQDTCAAVEKVLSFAMEQPALYRSAA
jgi:dTDP-4-amino-4,6-dideoxygalactose transaminase